MKNITDNTNGFKNILGLTLIVLITVAAIYCTYYLSFSSPVKSIIWIVWLVATIVLGLMTSKGIQLYNFAREAKIELQKVVWPTRQETVQTTVIVMVMVAVTGVILWAIDSGMMLIIGKLTHLG